MGNEGDAGGHAGHEGEEAGVEDCTGKVFAVCSVPWQQGQDRGRLEEGGPPQEQEWKDREQEGVGRWEEGLQADFRRTKAVQQARKQLKVKGFVAVKKSAPLYKLAKDLYRKSGEKRMRDGMR